MGQESSFPQQLVDGLSSFESFNIPPLLQGMEPSALSAPGPGLRPVGERLQAEGDDRSQDEDRQDEEDALEVAHGELGQLVLAGGIQSLEFGNCVTMCILFFILKEGPNGGSH